MATTTNKSLVEPAFNNTTGTLPDGTPYTSWDSPVNYNETVTDNAFGGVVAVSTAGITTTQTLTLAQYQPLIINFSGVLTVNLIYNFPTGVGGHWIIRNSCTGNFSLSVGSNGSTIVIPAGVSYYVYVDTSTAPYISFLNISGFRSYAGNPNTFVAGNVGPPASVVWDTVNSKLWVCTTAGIASAAVWTANYQGIFADANTWNNNNTFNGAVTSKEQTLTWASPSTAWNMSGGPDAVLTLSGTTTKLSAPTGQSLGNKGQLRIVQDSSGSRILTFDTSFVTDRGYVPSIFPGANAETTFNYRVKAASGAGSIILTPLTQATPHVIIEDQKASNTAAQNLTAGSDNPRNLNTLVLNFGTLASLSSNQFTLPAGTYYVKSYAGLNTSASGTGSYGRLIIFNVNDSVNQIIGFGGAGYVAGSTGGGSSIIQNLDGVFTISTQKTFELRNRISNSNCLGGSPMNDFKIEIYAHLEITKLS